MTQLQINRVAMRSAKPDPIIFEVTATKEEKKLINLIYKFNSFFVKMVSANFKNRIEDWNYCDNQRMNIIDDIMLLHSKLDLSQSKQFSCGVMTFNIPELLKNKFHFKKNYQGNY